MPGRFGRAWPDVRGERSSGRIDWAAKQEEASRFRRGRVMKIGFWRSSIDLRQRRFDRRPDKASLFSFLFFSGFQVFYCERLTLVDVF